MRSATIWAAVLALASGPILSHAALLPRDISNNEIKSEYDYVIVGGGVSGLTVGDRLTEDGKHTVLVIENGPFDDSDGVYAVEGGRQGFIPERIYNITSAPQTSLDNRTFGVSIGKMVGGGSGVNGMVSTRGTTEDYDRWDALWGGNSGWAWDDLLPYFKKAFTFTPPVAPLASEFNITYDLAGAWEPSPRDGIFATFPTWQWPGTKLLMQAFRAMKGVVFPKDGAAGTHGVFWFPNSVHPTNVTRHSARVGHLLGIDRPNYQLIARHKVTTITFDGNVAVGVKFTSPNGEILEVKAKKEVILAAGSVHTPQILQSSGVGPKALLEAAGIPVMVELPGVGQNFHDHPLVTMSATFDETVLDITATDLINNATFKAWSDEAWRVNKTGPKSLAGGNGVALLDFPLVSPEKYDSIISKYDSQTVEAYLPADTHPDVLAGYAAQKKLHSLTLRSNQTSIYQLYLNGFALQGAGVTMMQQVSRGSININTADPVNSEPIVDYRSFSNPVDLDIMVELVKFTAKYYLESPEIAPVKPVITSPYVYDEEIKVWLRQNIRPMEAHPIGTCSMLPRELGGVLDKQLRVYGIERLRVVDASMIPMHVGAAIQSTVYAVAEKAADLIKASA